MGRAADLGVPCSAPVFPTPRLTRSQEFPTVLPMNSSQSPDPEQVRQGETLRMARELRGLKLGELATAMGISYAYLSNIEAGRKRLTPQLVAKAAQVLGVRQAALVRSDLFGARVPA